MNDDPDALTQRLATRLLAKRQTACTAESCTGGLIAKTFTDLAGSSDWFECGFVTYSNAAKSEMLGVPPSVIEDYGAVSEAVANAMASCALRHSVADYAVAVTGVAGPGGGSDEKPVGTVFISLASTTGVHVKRYSFSGDRSRIQRMSATMALEWLRRFALQQIEK